ncbi:MAG: toll/interleukin-1 receptor domain-containing protein [Clostridiaceae bacterium]|nr:toll/interleukin-1 receptor domain-containing protein [Clostridiaceae bacterium]
MINTTEQNTAYDVFLSYRHKNRDNKICKKVHTLLETFKPPGRCKEASIKRVFRDDAELPAAGVLSDTINTTLKSSHVLLVICSKDTPESRWVDKEVRTFIELGRTDKIYALLIDDDPDMCFPSSLKLIPGIENRTLKVKYTAQGFSQKKLKEELLRVIAAATGTQFEHLRFAIRRRRLARSIFAGLILTVLLVAAGLYSLYQWVTASYYYAYTQREEILIKDIIDDINNNLVSAVKNIPEAAPALVKKINDNNMYLDRMMAIDGSTKKNIEAKARNYLNLARVYMITGDTKETLNASKEAIKIYEALAENSNDETKKRDLATCYNLTGLFMQYLSKYDRAIYYLDKAADVYTKLEKSFKNNEYSESLADCYNSMGVCHYLLKNYREAADTFVREINVRKKMSYDMSLTENQVLFAGLYADAASCYNSASENKKAADCYKQAVALYKDLYEKSNEPELHKAYVVSLYNLGINSAYEKDNAEAEYYLRLSIAEADKLVKESIPEYDPYYLSMYAMYDLLYAPDKKEEALNMVSIAFKRNSTDSFIRHIYAYCLLFNNYYDEALDILNTLINEDNSAEQKIKNDLGLFIIRGYSTDLLPGFMEDLRPSVSRQT